MRWLLAIGFVLFATAAALCMGPAKVELSKQREEYICIKIGEAIENRVEEVFEGNKWTERGHEMEAEAFAAFALATDAEPWTVGFVYRDESRRTGFSPDFMLDGAHGELKCPMRKTHIRYLRAGTLPAQYVPQLQFGLWCTGYPLAWFMSYYPGFRSLILRVEPDPRWQDALDVHVPAFLAEMDAAIEQLTGEAI